MADTLFAQSVVDRLVSTSYELRWQVGAGSACPCRHGRARRGSGSRARGRLVRYVAGALERAP